jgi:hypothetical protein
MTNKEYFDEEAFNEEYHAALKSNLVQDLFVRTADENYITARWCVFNHLHIDFFWLGVHALEKYMKAVLLLNGFSSVKDPNSKKYGHNIIRLYAKVKNLAQELLPNLLEKPQNLNIHNWVTLPAEKFIQRLYRYGNPDNRYLIYGFSMRSQDIHMLDQMVFAIRRLVCPLDDRAFSRRLRTAPAITNRDRLAGCTRHHGSLSMPLDTLIDATESSPAGEAALDLNYAFAPPDFPHQDAPTHHSFREPVIVRRILDPLERDVGIEESLKLAEWFLDNVQLPKDVKTEIDRAIAAAKRRSPS